MSKLTDKIDEARAAGRERLDTVKTEAGEKLDSVKEGASERIGSVKETASERFESAKELASEKSVVVRERMSESKQRAAELLSDGKEKSVAVTRETALKAKTKSEETIQKSPLSVVAGGIALGAIVAALLPRTKAETKVVGAAGRAVNDAARKTYETAKEVAQEQAAELGFSSAGFQEQIKDWLGKLLEGVKSAANEDKRDKS